MIKTENLQKIFKTEEVETWALNNVTLEIKEGEFVAIMGPSGCGKSTLLNILGLLDNPTNGTYELNGVEADRDERHDANYQQWQDKLCDAIFCPIDELFQPVLHQPPGDRHGDDIGYYDLDKERTVQ